MTNPITLFLAAAVGTIGNQAFPHRAGECRWVHGGFTVTNGSSINRIYVSGTKHALALRDDDDQGQQLVAGYWKFDSWLWADFFVCAREKYIPGHMQHVQILKIRRSVLTSR